MPQTRAITSRKTTSKTDKPPSLRMAALDIGTNSIHMVVAEADAEGSITPLWRTKEMVGLGRSTFPSRSFSKQTIDHAIYALAKFHKAAVHWGCEDIIAVATSAVREASNGGDLVRRVERRYGIDVRIISGHEEARLIYLGVRHGNSLGGQRHLMIDVGGGSVEFIVGDHHRALMMESVKLGAARLTAQFVKSDPINETDRKALADHLERELAPIVTEIQALKPERVIGTSGTLENLAEMCRAIGGGNQANGESNGHEKTAFIDRPDLNALVEKLTTLPASERTQLKAMDPQRKDQIVAGGILAAEIFKKLQLRRMYMSKTALREGILVDYLQKHRPDVAIRQQIPQPRMRSVVALARRCSWHRAHSEQVARLCVRLFDQTQSVHGFGAAQRELIEYAALLHDIGWHIGRNKHHKHSMYLIENGDLKNFTPEEINIIANIARYHRKATPKLKHTQYARLSPSARRIVDVGAALLRIADGLDRSHSNVVRELRCRCGEKQIKCTLAARWDAELEIWGARRKATMFEKVFRKPIEFEVVRG